MIKFRDEADHSSSSIQNFLKTIIFNIVARDLPGGKRILIINMRAQHTTFNEAIKTVNIFKEFLIVTFLLILW